MGVVGETRNNAFLDEEDCNFGKNTGVIVTVERQPAGRS